MKIKFILVLFVTFLMMNLAFATENNILEVKYTDTTLSKNYKVGRVEPFIFKIKNEDFQRKNVIIKRKVLNGMGEKIIEKDGWDLKYSKDPTINNLDHVEYETSINPGEEIEMELESKFTIIPSNGKLEIPKVIVIDTETNKIISATETRFIEIQCNTDGVCDHNIHENFKNCPQDCDSGQKDLWCDRKQDRKCDPDCLDYLDPDCKEGEGNQIFKTLKVIVEKLEEEMNSFSSSILKI